MCTLACAHEMLPWWRHQMETFSAWMVLCAGNSPVPGEFPAQRPVARSFNVFFDLCLNKRLSKQSWGWWFDALSHPLWRHRNAYGICVLRLPELPGGNVLNENALWHEQWWLLKCDIDVLNIYDICIYIYIFNNFLNFNPSFGFLHVRRKHTCNWWVNIGPGNGLVPSSNKPLPEAIMTQIYVTKWRQ